MAYWDYFDDQEENNEPRILWLSVDKYVSNSYHSDYVMHVQHIRLMEIVNIYKRLIDKIASGNYRYAVVVLSEGVILSMLDEMFKSAVFSVITAIRDYDIPHTVFIGDYLIKGKQFKIAHQDYFVNFIRTREYKLHTSVALTLIGDMYPSKTDVFKSFVSEYLKTMLFRAHDRGYEDLLTIMLNSVLYSDMLSIQERRILLTTVGTTMFFDSEEARKYKERETQENNVIYVMDCELDPAFSTTRYFDSSENNYNSDEYCLEDSLFKDLNVVHVLQEANWKNCYTYAKRNCRERKTASSVNTMTNTLSKKLFFAFLNSMDLVPDEEEKAQILSKAQDIIAEVKHNKNINVLPFADEKEILTYVESLLGKEAHMVSKQYILRDFVWADELDQYLTMFQNYMSDIRHIKISIEREHTENGVLYVISSSSDEVYESNFHVFTNAFAELLSQIAIDQKEAAKEIVEKYNISERNAERIVRDYQRKCDTLRREIKYGYQRRMLDIQEELEKGLSDAIDSQSMQAEMEKQASQIDEMLSYTTDIIELERGFLKENSDSSMFTGNYKYADHEDELIQLFWKYDSDPQALVNELNIARDMSSLQKKRIESTMRIMQFLGRYEIEIGLDKVSELYRYVSELRGDDGYDEDEEVFILTHDSNSDYDPSMLF